MSTISIDLSKLHGFRLLATPASQQTAVLAAESLPQLLGARLGRKVGKVGSKLD